MDTAENTGTLEQIGPYSVLRQLGKGGYGKTFLVERTFAPDVTQRFCLKQIHGSLTSEDEFLEEAKALSRLGSHPGIVQLVDFFHTDDEGCVLVMDYVKGVDLSQLQRFLRHQHPPERLPASLCAYIAAKTCAALAHAHECSRVIAHRDVAPSNIFLGFAGNVKLGDFGIASFQGRGKYTETHQYKGKLSYMSPEHFSNTVDAQSDLFALGIVLYEMLAGKLPFGPSNDLPKAYSAIMNARFTPLHELNPDIDRRLARLTHDMLAPSKDARPASAAEVEQALLGFTTLDAELHLRAYVERCMAGSDTLNAPSLAFNPPTLGSDEFSEHASALRETRAARPSREDREPSTPPASAAPAARRPFRSLALVAFGSSALSVLLMLALRPTPQNSPPANANQATSLVPAPAQPIASGVADDEQRAESEPSPAIQPDDEPKEDPETVVATPADNAPVDATKSARPEQKTRPAKLSVLVHNYGTVRVDDAGPFPAPLKAYSVSPGRHLIRIYPEECTREKLNTPKCPELRRKTLTLRPGRQKTEHFYVTDNAKKAKP